jgi:predicted oxidoreductase
MAVQTVPSERPFIFTKCGLIWDERNPMEEPKRVLRPESIRAECEASLRRLGLERIDLYQFHWPDETGTPVEDSWAEMLRLIQEGKVGLGGWIGAANLELTPADLDEIARAIKRTGAGTGPSTPNLELAEDRDVAYAPACDGGDLWHVGERNDTA